MPSPRLPARVSRGWGTDRLAAVEFPLSGDADDGSPFSELLVGHVPRRVRFFGYTPVQSSPLLGGWKVEIAHLHGRTEVGSCLT